MILRNNGVDFLQDMGVTVVMVVVGVMHNTKDIGHGNWYGFHVVPFWNNSIPKKVVRSSHNKLIET
jgi:hypothetical protein